MVLIRNIVGLQERLSELDWQTWRHYEDLSGLLLIYTWFYGYISRNTWSETSPTAHGNNFRETDETEDPRNDIVFVKSVFFCSRAWTGFTRLCTFCTIKQSTLFFFYPRIALNCKMGYKLSIDGNFLRQCSTNRSIIF